MLGDGIETLTPSAKAQITQYSLRQVSLKSPDAPLLTDWKTFVASAALASPMQDPEWLRGYFCEELGNISTFLIYDADTLRGSASFLQKQWPVKLHLGPLPVGELPLRRLRFLAGTLPDEEGVYDLIVRQLLASPNYDALYFAQIPVGSFLWNYLAESPLIRKHFRRYVSEDPSPHPLLRFPVSFDEYMKKFSKTHRHTLRRKVTRFQEEAPGKTHLECYTRPEEVIPFLTAATEVSRKTYQWNLHHRGLRAADRLRQRYSFAAEHGWFRSYLLFCDETPYAFLSGYQWNRRYYTDEIGYDPALARRSPGLVLQMLAIQDLFANDRPDLIDFGSYDKYKEELANDSYQHCSLFLFRRTSYSRAVQGVDHACRVSTNIIARILRRLNVKGAVKNALKASSVALSSASFRSKGANPTTPITTAFRPASILHPIERLKRYWKQRGCLATLRFVLSRLGRRQIELVYYAHLDSVHQSVSWDEEERLLQIGPENVDAMMTPQLRGFLGGDAAVENIEGIHDGDRLFVVVHGNEYVHRGYILFGPHHSKLLGDRAGLPVIGYCSTASSARGRGVYRRALNAELSYLRDQGYKRALIAVEPKNEASRKGIEGAGFLLGWESRAWIILNRFVVQRLCNRSGAKWKAQFVRKP